MQKEEIRIDLDGFYVEPELVPLDTYGVMPIYGMPEPEPEEEEQPESVLVGYRVAVPVPSGLYKPRYDLDGWQAALAAYDDAMDAYREALAAHDPESEDEQPQPPAPVDLQAFWIEGLTQQEIDDIRNAPRPETIHDQVARLQTESVDTMLALTEVYETTGTQAAALEQESVDTMLALTEAYELIMALEARIAALEGGDD
ncbi:hypothetical protein ACFFNY_21865 [Paenibacillus hodogayensis]|uniref:Bacteriophage SP-beta YorD domain-containing protein n=1 Tax=Paenibacillus hodogayensis TaxID=279208 RepID=A0ABV5W122_9BACL